MKCSLVGSVDSGLLLALVLLPSVARADGKVFARTAIALPVNTPSQRAMLSYSNGVEKLVIETTFLGEGTNFAWVLPVPSAPKIEAVSTNFFPLLAQTFQPRLITDASANWMFYLIFGAMIAIAIREHRAGRGVARTLLTFVVLLFLAAMLGAPAFVRSRGVTTVAAAGEVAILNEQKAGLFDTVTLASRDGQALLNWLNAHGFHTPTNALPVIAAYAADGWAFVAVNIDRSDTGHTRTRLHPLAFTFASTQAVYPLRLTAVDNDRTELELFVFGPGTARAGGLEASYSGAVTVPCATNEEVETKKEFFAYPGPGEFRVGTPELQHFILPATAATKLTGTLSGRDMAHDARIDWVPCATVFPTFYTADAARTAALDWLFGLGAVGGLVIQIAAPRLKRRTIVRSLLAVLLVAALAGFVRRVTIKQTEVKWMRGGWLHTVSRFRELDGTLLQLALERTNAPPLTFAELRAGLSNYSRWAVANCFTGEELREGATPGNLVLVQTSNEVEVLWHDINGAPHPLCTFRRSGKLDR